MEIALFLLSASFGISGYSFYWNDIRKESVAPNRWSWLIWSFTTAVEALTYDAANDGGLKSLIFYISAFCCIALAVKIWSQSVWKRVEWNEALCLIASMISLVIWLVFKQTEIAHFIAVGTLPIAFIPTWIAAWRHWQHEDSKSWILWSIGDFLAIMTILSNLKSDTELPYAVMEFVCHGAVAAIVIFRRWREKLEASRISE
jgi:uncharacterized membrane protein